MVQTVVGVFDSDVEARAVQDELIQMGVPAGEIMLHAGTGEARDVASDTAAYRDRDRDSGGIMGFFRSLFGGDDDEHAVRYSEAVRRGSHVVTVHVADEQQAERVEDIMQRHDAIDIDERESEWRASGWRGYDADAPALSDDELARERGDVSGKIPVVQEELRVGKRVVSRGGVRVFTRMTETPVEEQVSLREEHARVKRTPVDRPATAADVSAARDGETIEVRETIEEPVVEKVARVVEEIDIDKDVSERTETVRDSVKRTEVDVESLEGSGRRRTREEGTLTSGEPVTRNKDKPLKQR